MTRFVTVTIFVRHFLSCHTRPREKFNELRCGERWHRACNVSDMNQTQETIAEWLMREDDFRCWNPDYPQCSELILDIAKYSVSNYDEPGCTVYVFRDGSEIVDSGKFQARRGKAI